MMISVSSGRCRGMALLCICMIGCNPTVAQVGLNIDIDFNLPGEPAAGPPSAGYPAAGGQPGVWNSVSFGTGPIALVGLDGAPSGVSISRSIVPSASIFDTGGTGDYARLVYDADRIDSALLDYTITGLPAGTYIVYTYAAAPSFGTVATRITIQGVSQTVASAPTNFTFVEGGTHARHIVPHAGGPLVIRAERAGINGVVNGFQIVPFVVQPPAPFSLTMPPNGANGQSLTPVLAWEASGGADDYAVTLDTDEAFTPPVLFQETTTQTVVLIPAGVLSPDTRYFWRVVARNEGGATPGSPDPASFTTAATPPPPPATFGINIDLDVDLPGKAGTGPPFPAFGAAPGQAGVWNSVMPGVGPFSLVGLQGEPTPVTISRSGVLPIITFDTGGRGDYARLVYDADRIDGPSTFTVSGLPAGAYNIYTYAAAPFFGTIATRVTINGVSQVVASAPADFTFVEGATHARHTISHPGGLLTIHVDKAGVNGVVNGIQIVPAVQSATASILSPGACSVLIGTVPVIGTALGSGLTNWTLEYTGGDSNTWMPIASSNTPVSMGLLGEWETRGLRPCGYTLRLRVTTSGGSIETMRSLVLAVEGDGNLDGLVDFRDLTQVLTNFGRVGP